MKALEQQIKQWVISADKYHYLLESEEDYIAKEITKLCVEFAREAYAAGEDSETNDNNGHFVRIPFEEWLNEQK